MGRGSSWKNPGSLLVSTRLRDDLRSPAKTWSFCAGYLRLAMEEFSGILPRVELAPKSCFPALGPTLW